eukprot:1142195-Rhodomonas_salina.1
MSGIASNREPKSGGFSGGGARRRAFCAPRSRGAGYSGGGVRRPGQPPRQDSSYDVPARIVPGIESRLAVRLGVSEFPP